MNDMNFDTALAAFVTAVQGLADRHCESFSPNLSPPRIEIMIGPKYVRIVRQETYSVARSAYCFVEKETGNILKADSWKRPAKGVRGNIYDANPVAGCTPYGAAYAR